jgi:hypothetical protein
MNAEPVLNIYIYIHIYTYIYIDVFIYVESWLVSSGTAASQMMVSSKCRWRIRIATYYAKRGRSVLHHEPQNVNSSFIYIKQDRGSKTHNPICIPYTEAHNQNNITERYYSPTMIKTPKQHKLRSTRATRRASRAR